MSFRDEATFSLQQPLVLLHPEQRGCNVDVIQRSSLAVHVTPAWDRPEARDALGRETSAMLADRILRSADHYGAEYKGQRLPYEPRLGPAQKSDIQQRDEIFQHELEELCARLGVEINDLEYAVVPK